MMICCLNISTELSFVFVFRINDCYKECQKNNNIKKEAAKNSDLFPIDYDKN